MLLIRIMRKVIRLLEAVFRASKNSNYLCSEYYTDNLNWELNERTDKKTH